MAAENRETEHRLIRRLQEDGRRFEFFQLVRLLEMLAPEAPRVGHQGPPGREAIRFRPALTLAFHNSDIFSVEDSELLREDGSWREDVVVTFLGLYGTASPLPTYYTEELLELARLARGGTREDEGLTRRFLDLFHHRLTSLFYRVWAKYRVAINLRPDFSDWFATRLMQMLHITPDMLPDGHRVHAQDMLSVASHVTHQPRSATTLLGILREYFGEDIPIDLEQCVGQWIGIPPEQQNRLGVANHQLGRDCLPGTDVWDCASTFRVMVGPLDIHMFMLFLPPGEYLARLKELSDLFNPDCLQMEVELRIEQDQIPELRLSSETALLGWSSWLGTPPEGTSHVRFTSKDWLHGRR